MSRKLHQRHQQLSYPKHRKVNRDLLRSSLTVEQKARFNTLQQDGCRVCRMHGARGGAPTGKKNGNYRTGTRTKEAIQAMRLINLLSRFARKS
jgi:hypothetical protein